MSEGLPDYTTSMNIAAVSVASIPIDIKSQSIATLKIDIAAQTVGNIAINIASSAVTLQVNIASQTSNIAVNIAASAVTLQVNIASQTSNIAVNIAASAVTLNMNISSISGGVTFSVAQSGTWTINAAQSGSWTIAVTESGTWTINVETAAGVKIDVDIAEQSLGNLGIDIKAQTIGNIAVNIAASAITLNVNLSSSSITLNVNISSQSAFNLGIDIKAQTIGNVSVNLAASAITLNVAVTGTASVNIAAQAVDLNIKTSGGTNIVIDKLTQSAFTNRGWETGCPAPADYVREGDGVGRFFSRGMRGGIRQISAYLKNGGVGAENVTFNLAPYPGCGTLYSKTTSVAPSVGESVAILDWADLPTFWQYDSMFVWAEWATAGADIQIGHTGATLDYTGMRLYGTKWLSYDVGDAICIRVFIRPATVGDLPVSGTLNTIQIPNSTATLNATATSCADNAETTLFTQYGAGVLKYLKLDINYATFTSGGVDAKVRVYADGALVWELGFNDLAYIYLNSAGAHAFSTPAAAAHPLAIAVNMNDEYTRMIITIEFPFQQNLSARIYNATGAARSVNHWATLNMLK